MLSEADAEELTSIKHQQVSALGEVAQGRDGD
jgi:hypothetical protein